MDWSVDTPQAAAQVIKAQVHDAATIIANPLSPSEQLDPALHARVLSAGLAAVEKQGIHGKAVTPFLLEFFRGRTAGKSVQVNLQLVRANARLATEIAAAL